MDARRQINTSSRGLAPELRERERVGPSAGVSYTEQTADLEALYKTCGRMADCLERSRALLREISLRLRRRP